MVGIRISVLVLGMVISIACGGDARTSGVNNPTHSGEVDLSFGPAPDLNQPVDLLIADRTHG